MARFSAVCIGSDSATTQRIVHDDVFWQSLRNSVYYTVLVIPSVLVTGSGSAALLNRPIRFRALFLVLLIVPSVASTVAASVIWSYLLQFDGGLFNRLLGLVGIDPVTGSEIRIS